MPHAMCLHRGVEAADRGAELLCLQQAMQQYRATLPMALADLPPIHPIQSRVPMTRRSWKCY